MQKMGGTQAPGGGLGCRPPCHRRATLLHRRPHPRPRQPRRAQKGKRADYLLCHTRDISWPSRGKGFLQKGADGLQQAKEYAEILGSSGPTRQTATKSSSLTSPRARKRNAPISLPLRTLGAPTRASKSDCRHRRRAAPHPVQPHRRQGPALLPGDRHYRVVQAILQGHRRVLLTMATGTGKTVVAFRFVGSSGPPNGIPRAIPPQAPHPLPRRPQFLVDDPKDKIFAPFGDARYKIEGGEVVFSREMYFATYQALPGTNAAPAFTKNFRPTFSTWSSWTSAIAGAPRKIPVGARFSNIFPAYQLGMTATPFRDETRDSYLYFGNPLYTYSLRQGIDDGFLAPYRVYRIVTQWELPAGGLARTNSTAMVAKSPMKFTARRF